MYPVKLKPIYKDYIWGGDKLKLHYNKTDAPAVTAESWELAVRDDVVNTISGGEADGKTLFEYLQVFPEAAGERAKDRFPVLLKLIDARESLSVQVHPGDAYAREHENDLGKTECWHILDCEPGAFIYLGVNRTLTKDEFLRFIAENRLEEVLNKVFVFPGETYFIPSGTIHAIGKDITIAELQQNSNVTYRLYDYGRGRELHTQKGAEVTVLNPQPVARLSAVVNVNGTDIEILSCCELFALWKINFSAKTVIQCDKTTFIAATCVSGCASLNALGVTLPFQKGETIFIPAGAGQVVFEGEAQVLLSSLN